MSCAFRRALLAIAIACTCACKKSEPPAPDAAAVDGEHFVGERCVAPFRCRGPCLTFAESCVSAREAAQLQCKFTKACAATAESGRCGELSYTRSKDAYGESIEYFTPDGKALARIDRSPQAIYCGMRANEAYFGPVPSCTHELVDDYVPGSPTPRLGRRDAR